MVNIGASDIIQGRPASILGLTWQLIRVHLLAQINLKVNPIGAPMMMMVVIMTVIMVAVKIMVIMLLAVLGCYCPVVVVQSATLCFAASFVMYVGRMVPPCFCRASTERASLLDRQKRSSVVG